MRFLQETIKKELDSGRIGTPVFVRCIAQIASSRKKLNDANAEVLSIINSWLNSSPERVYTQTHEEIKLKLPGLVAAEQITTAIRYAAGQSALVSVGLAIADTPQTDLIIIGNKGAIYYDGLPTLSSISSIETDNHSTPAKPSKPNRPYGVLLVAGLRTHQENYARLFAADPRCRLVAVTDELDVLPQRAEWNRNFAEEMKLPYIPDLDSALARDDIDIVSICAEHERRGRVAVKCAQAGKHLYLDKPMTCSIEDAEAVVAAVSKAGVKSQVFSFIHYPWARAAKRALQSGAIGDLIAIHSDVLFAKGYAGTAPLGAPRKQEPYPKRFTFIDSKRELRATGVYAMGLVRWLTQREVKRVYGITANYFFQEHFKNDVEDFGLLAMTLDNGITATVTGGRIGWMSHPHGGPSRLYLIGTKGSLRVDAYAPRIEIYADEPTWTPPPINPADPMSFWQSTQKEVDTKPKRLWIPSIGSSNDASRFIDYIESGCESEMSAKDGAAVVKALMTGYISAAKGEAISLL